MLPLRGMQDQTAPTSLLAAGGGAVAAAGAEAPLSAAAAAEAAGLLERFEDVQPQLLLFLQRLQRLAITRAQEGACVLMSRRQVRVGLCLRACVRVMLQYMGSSYA